MHTRISFAVFGGAFLAMCFLTAMSHERAADRKVLPLFSLTNAVLEGKEVQVLKSTFGLGILPRRRDLTVRFGSSGSILITFDESTLKPKSIFLTLAPTSTSPEQKIFDYDGDGMPDVRQVDGKARELFYRGRWYAYQIKGTNNLIEFNSKPLLLFFDGAGAGWRPTAEGRPSGRDN